MNETDTHASTPTGVEPFTEALQLIAELVDPDECWVDHHGGCQAHGYINLDEGETCPVERAKEFLAAQEEVSG